MLWSKYSFFASYFFNWSRWILIVDIPIQNFKSLVKKGTLNSCTSEGITRKKIFNTSSTTLAILPYEMEKMSIWLTILTFGIWNHQIRFINFWFNEQNSKSGVCSSQVCTLHTIHSCLLRQEDIVVSNMLIQEIFKMLVITSFFRGRKECYQTGNSRYSNIPSPIVKLKLLCRSKLCLFQSVKVSCYFHRQKHVFFNRLMSNITLENSAPRIQHNHVYPEVLKKCVSQWAAGFLMSNKELVKSRVLLSNINALFTTTRSYLTPVTHMLLIVSYISQCVIFITF